MSLTRISVNELYKELVKRRRKLPRLKRARAGIMRKLATVYRKLAKVDAVIVGLGGGSVGRSRRSGGHAKALNKVNLVTALHAAMKGKVMGVEEACAAVRIAGYQSNSPNFRVMVSQKLNAKQNKKLFRRVERGRYTTV